MSRVSVRHGSGAAPADDETCPVCKTTRYFNPDMEFRVNTECYHLMCKTCMERIFKDGPNQCPYAECNKTLRLRGFKKAFFGDLKVEREVDIRRRVAQVFNKVEDDFESLDAYNDYLYMVECLTDDLVNGKTDARARAEAQLAEWEAQHRADIERNRRLARESDEARQKRLAAEQDAARQRRLQELRDDADERASAARFREEMLDSLANAEVGHAGEAVDRVLLKKRGQQRSQAALQAAAAAAGAGAGLSIRGLRDKTRPAADDGKPYDPFGGLDLAPSRVDLSEDRMGGYHSEWVDVIRSKDEYRVGGYSADEYISRALFEAFSGLGVFVAEDKVDREISTAGAREAAMVDV
ncbi:kinase [Purpureocillium lilacinum]|uniref:RNA polymerase II transcription factor B subunit 3 n=1 Tax=Purpureocillium lilacinum TaxID=33203 RepID=A0A2U3EEU8_PURLI|nr:kinase [Purpureocillium lilacinum]